MRTQYSNLDGSKMAQPKINKKIHSANIRAKRKLITQSMPNFNKNFCNECGFRIRGKGHLEGAHHNGCVAICKRG